MKPLDLRAELRIRDEGWRAARDNIARDGPDDPRTMCRYRPGTAEAALWHEGYTKALRDYGLIHGDAPAA